MCRRLQGHWNPLTVSSCIETVDRGEKIPSAAVHWIVDVFELLATITNSLANGFIDICHGIGHTPVTIGRWKFSGRWQD
ncbi:MAG: hypothetical protein J7J76_04955 [Candidatus Latescibacteria bacterium]|nr:hypothetical protein [Candidatus Latescibacterota bacterium]